MFSRLASALILTTLAARLASADAGQNRYFLRAEHGTPYSNTCVLLQTDGAYHLEIDAGDTTRVFEGSLQADQLQQLRLRIKTLFAALSQGRIEEPLIRHTELVKLDVSREGRWTEVQFLSTESQEPYKKSLQPLIRWLNELHKLPHKELSEDEGKNNCLVPRKIELKERGNRTSSSSSIGNSSPPPSLANAPGSTYGSGEVAPTTQPRPVQPLLRADSFGVKSGTFYKNCVLVLEDGSYRAEDQSQKTGSKKVETNLKGGKLTGVEIGILRGILADPALAGIRHRQTSHLELPVTGEMLELKIPRESGLQDIVLSTTFNKSGMPFFYSGDGDIGRAHQLRQFISEHVDNNGLGSLAPQMQNGCTDAP